uniref:Uncharacterized protein n=1 Tax=Timema tahoe TaxID=61484 RepID=A0A7R9IQV9_9NEOP|nr:unnamed protein product [Timema tahoe]
MSRQPEKPLIFSPAASLGVMFLDLKRTQLASSVGFPSPGRLSPEACPLSNFIPVLQLVSTLSPDNSRSQATIVRAFLIEEQKIVVKVLKAQQASAKAKKEK